MFLSPNPDYSYFSEDLMIKPLKMSKFRTLEHFYNYFWTHILTPKFRICPGNSGRMTTLS